MGQTRRQMMQRVMYTAMALPILRLIGRADEIQTVEPVTGRRLALRAVRVVNTMQSRYKKVHGAYGSLKDLAVAAAAGTFSDVVPDQILRQIALTGKELVPGFSAKLQLGPKSGSYSLQVVEVAGLDDDRFAYSSDETGVIQEGQIKSAKKDEFVRHKILDAIGDLSLVGYPVIGHLVAHRAGHALHTAFAARILEEADAWKIVEGDAAPALAGVPVSAPARAAARLAN